MNDFFQKLAADAENVDLAKVAGPDDEITGFERIAGTLSDELKRFYMVRDQRLAAAKMLEQDFACACIRSDGVETEEVVKAMRLATIAKVEHELISDYFWYLVRLECPGVASKPQIGLRANWSIVWIDDDQEGYIIVPLRVY